LVVRLAGGYLEEDGVAVAVKVGGPRVETPALDAARAARERGELETLGAFIDWLRDEKELVLAQRGREVVTFVKCRECSGRGRAPGTPRDRQLLRAGVLSTSGFPACEVCRGGGRVTDSRIDDAGLTHVGWYPEQLIGEFLGIDPAAMEDEKMALLAAIRDEPPPRGWHDNEGVWARDPF
jgi:hypothetical protein